MAAESDFRPRGEPVAHYKQRKAPLHIRMPNKAVRRQLRLGILRDRSLNAHVIRGHVGVKVLPDVRMLHGLQWGADICQPFYASSFAEPVAISMLPPGRKAWKVTAGSTTWTDESEYKISSPPLHWLLPLATRMPAAASRATGKARGITTPTNTPAGAMLVSSVRSPSSHRT